MEKPTKNGSTKKPKPKRAYSSVRVKPRSRIIQRNKQRQRKHYMKANFTIFNMINISVI